MRRKEHLGVSSNDDEDVHPATAVAAAASIQIDK